MEDGTEGDVKATSSAWRRREREVQLLHANM